MKRRIADYLGPFSLALLVTAVIVWVFSDSDDLAFWMMTISSLLSLIAATWSAWWRE